MAGILGTLTKEERADLQDDDFSEVPPSDIVAYNELRSCADLFRMFKQGILNIQPEFQRQIVWKDADQTRFIDSLIKQLPIPSMCFSLDYKTQEWQVIDGLQRMAAVFRFLSGENWTLSRLSDIDQKIAGKKVVEFQNPGSPLHSYYKRLENLTLPVTVLRCDYSKRSHTNYLFTIFHRLNAGGVKLNNQEIRNCIFAGPFNNLLRELNENPAWMKINRINSASKHRFIPHEIILRFFAFKEGLESYDGRLATFLNMYMADHQFADEREIDKKRSLFNQTVDLFYHHVLREDVKSKLTISVLEAALVGISSNIRFLSELTSAKAAGLYQKFTDHEEFSEQKLAEGLAKKPRLQARMRAAKQVFSGR